MCHVAPKCLIDVLCGSEVCRKCPNVLLACSCIVAIGVICVLYSWCHGRYRKWVMFISEIKIDFVVPEMCQKCLLQGIVPGETTYLCHVSPMDASHGIKGVIV